MTREIAIVGDVHGELSALIAIVDCALESTDTLVFVGDYINRGPQSADVVDFLIELKRGEHDCIFLRGNHETEFLTYLEGGPVTRFLAIGGAATIKSYCRPDDLLEETNIRSLIPDKHLEFLKDLSTYFHDGRLLVTHSLTDPVPADLQANSESLYRIAGHVPQATRRPRITDAYSLVDTGSGTWEDGVLTCLFWPSGNWIQR